MRVGLLVLLITPVGYPAHGSRLRFQKVPAVPISGRMVRFEHVFVVVEENGFFSTKTE
jgi:hypothetical protein